MTKIETPPMFNDLNGPGNIADYYEQLRVARIKLDPTGSQAMGAGIFILRGMMGWIKVLSTLTPQTVEHTKDTWADPTMLPPENHSDMVNLLANMIISCVEGST